jgi:hypothetical protein
MRRNPRSSSSSSSANPSGFLNDLRLHKVNCDPAQIPLPPTPTLIVSSISLLHAKSSLRLARVDGLPLADGPW